MTLLHAMHESISNRILDDYAHIGPLSKRAEGDAMDKYIESTNVAVASVANLKLVSSKVIKALAHKFQGEFTPHFKSVEIARSQAAAGVGGTMADSHVPPPRCSAWPRPRHNPRATAAQRNPPAAAAHPAAA